MRDIQLGATFDKKFVTTEPDTGAPTTLSGTPVISAYVGNSTTQITAGITLTVDFDGVTGLNNVRVVATAANGYTDGTDVQLVITTGTVDGNSAVGYVVEEFTIGKGASELKQMLGHKTTIATLASQTSFTLTAGSADDNAYNGWAAYVIDQSTATQIALGVVSDYTGSTKTITLREDPAVFTMATGDTIILLPGKLTDGVNVTELDGDAQSLTDLKDFADAGYDPSTNKVQGVVLTDTATNLTNAPTAGDLTATMKTSVQTAAAAALTDYDPPTNAEMVARTLASADYATATGVSAVETDTQDIQSRLPAALNNGVMPADIQRINDVEVAGDGDGTPWGPAA